MYCNNCESDPCTCTQTRQDTQTPRAFKLAPTYDHRGAITKEQFGMNLFDCIKAFSARNAARERGAEDVAARYDLEAHRLIQTLEPADQRAILAKFETSA